MYLADHTIAVKYVQTETQKNISPSGSSAQSSTAAQQPVAPRNILWVGHSQQVAELNNHISRQAGGLLAVSEFEKTEYLDILKDPLEWWKDKTKLTGLKHFTSLIVPKWLCIPATSCPAESLFSSAGELISKTRSRLSDSVANQILFLHKN
jgi:hypothetical protein